MHSNCFRLVIGVVADSDSLRPDRLGDLGQKRVARLAGCFFDG
jgi:hypothetical protein